MSKKIIKTLVIILLFLFVLPLNTSKVSANSDLFYSRMEEIKKELKEMPLGNLYEISLDEFYKNTIPIIETTKDELGDKTVVVKKFINPYDKKIDAAYLILPPEDKKVLNVEISIEEKILPKAIYDFKSGEIYGPQVNGIMPNDEVIVRVTYVEVGSVGAIESSSVNTNIKLSESEENHAMVQSEEMDHVFGFEYGEPLVDSYMPMSQSLLQVLNILTLLFFLIFFVFLLVQIIKYFIFLIRKNKEKRKKAKKKILFWLIAIGVLFIFYTAGFFAIKFIYSDVDNEEISLRGSFPSGDPRAWIRK